jgi:tRNA threonylcarbamoyl adenosine modification protein YeaZ
MTRPPLEGWVEGWVLAIEVSNPSISSTADSVDPTRRFGPGVSLGRAHDNGTQTFIEHVGTHWLDAGVRSDDGLMPAIAALCDQHGIAARDLAAIAVSTGPGGFTGLRVAVTAAQCIALATGARVIDVGTHAVALASVWGDVVAKSSETHGETRGEMSSGTASGTGIIIGVGLASKASAVSVAWAEGPAVSPRFEADVFAQLDTAESLDADGVQARAPDLFVADTHLPETVRAVIGADRIVTPRLSPEVLLALAPLGRVIEASQLRPRYAREPEAVRLWRERHA